MPRAWRIYYGDGATFSDADGPPSDAPALDVQAIVFRDETPGAANVGRFVLQGFDFYWHDEGEWFGGELFGLFDYLQRPGAKAVKFGRTRPNRAFADVLERAVSDPDFPAKSASSRRER